MVILWTLNKDPTERKQMQLEGLLFEVYDKADWSKFFPPVGHAGITRLDHIQGLVTRVTARIAKIRKYAEDSSNSELLRLLDYTDDADNAEKR